MPSCFVLVSRCFRCYNENDKSALVDMQMSMGHTLKSQENLEQKEGVTERLKAENQLKWVGVMNNIADRVREIVR